MPRSGQSQRFRDQSMMSGSPFFKGKSDSHRGLGKFALSLILAATACSPIDAPDPRTPNIPAPQAAEARRKALNEANDSILIVDLAKDVLVPKTVIDEPLPDTLIGPLNFRGETLSNALEVILGDYNVPIAFETNEGLRRRITVSNLSGSVDKVVDKVCSMANLYCAYEDGVLTIRDTQIFTVAMPPFTNNEVGGGSQGNGGGGGGNGGGGNNNNGGGNTGGGNTNTGGGNNNGGGGGTGGASGNITAGLQSIVGSTVNMDTTTNTIIYSASQRTAKMAEQYFTRLRARTALIVYETYIWEVQLNNANASGIRWQQLDNIGAFNVGLNAGSGTLSNVVSGTPISIGLPTRGEVDFAAGDVFRFLSQQGAVKTISQPQISVLSGSSANLSVNEERNYVSELTRTITDQGQESVSTSTDTVSSGFDLNIDSAWDDSTVYGRINITLDEFLGFEDFQAGTNGTLSLPRTSSREISTTVRVRPGDSILIGGLVREQDTYDRTGPGFNQPIIPTDRSTSTDNTELVIMMRPRVVVYKPIDQAAIDAAKDLPQDLSKFVYDPSGPQADTDLTVDLVDPSQGPQIVAEPIKDAPVPAPEPDTVPMPAKEKDWRK